MKKRRRQSMVLAENLPKDIHEATYQRHPTEHAEWISFNNVETVLIISPIAGM